MRALKNKTNMRLDQYCSVVLFNLLKNLWYLRLPPLHPPVLPLSHPPAQTMYRSKVARRELRQRQAAKMAEMRAEQERLEREAEEMSAIKMQSHMRGHMARKAAEERRVGSRYAVQCNA